METGLDYKALGFKCGIEIHQQLDTHKLFCSCPSRIREEDPDYSVQRKMRAVAGEIGNVDPAALYEFLKDREMSYEGYSDTTCLVELDEEPPHRVNSEALEAVLEIAVLLNARPVDEVHVMRKTVIDGSNTSGFQRTLMVASDGFIETSKGKVNIPTICLEEDAARKIEEKDGLITYRLDRLGIPLVEIATDPDIVDAAHAREVAEKLGMILRATGKVKRGLGTIRQDINVSIPEGERIEIKGVQDLKSIEAIVEGEVRRQLMLVEVREALRERKITEKDLDQEIVELTEVFAKTDSKLVKKMLASGARAYGVKLPGYAGLLKGMLGPQLAQYAKSAAGVKGIFHSDELPGYGIEEGEVQGLREKFGLGEFDAFALVLEKEDTAKKAIEEVLRRAKIALKEVPEETRRAGLEGRTEFMRPLPGSARMYPETDEALITVTSELMGKIKKNLPEMPEEKLDRYLKMGLGSELSGQLVKSRLSGDFDLLAEKHPGLKATLVATTLLSSPKEARKRFNADPGKLGREHFDQILERLEKKQISKDIVTELIAAVSEDPDGKMDEIIEKAGLGMVGRRELEALVDRTVKENKERIDSMGPKAAGFLMGKVMAETKGRADPGAVKEIIDAKL